MTRTSRFIFQHGNSVFINEDGVRFLLKDVEFGDMVCDGSLERNVQEYKVTGPKGMDTIAWLMANFPEIQFVDPVKERIDALAFYHKAIGDAAVEKYKRENGIE